MSTLNQVEAHRLNARKEYRFHGGPGRLITKFFQTGIYSKSLIIRGEKIEDLETLTAEYYERYEPEDPEERDLVDTLIRDVWQLRRYANVEAQLWEYQMAQCVNMPGDLEENIPVGQAFSEAGQHFARLHRMVAGTKRSFKENLRKLERVQAARAAENGPTQLIACWADDPPKELIQPRSRIPNPLKFQPTRAKLASFRQLRHNPIPPSDPSPFDPSRAAVTEAIWGRRRCVAEQAEGR